MIFGHRKMERKGYCSMMLLCSLWKIKTYFGKTLQCTRILLHERMSKIFLVNNPTTMQNLVV